MWPNSEQAWLDSLPRYVASCLSVWCVVTRRAGCNDLSPYASRVFSHVLCVFHSLCEQGVDGGTSCVLDFCKADVCTGGPAAQHTADVNVTCKCGSNVFTEEILQYNFPNPHEAIRGEGEYNFVDSVPHVLCRLEPKRFPINLSFCLFHHGR